MVATVKRHCLWISRSRIYDQPVVIYINKEGSSRILIKGVLPLRTVQFMPIGIFYQFPSTLIFVKSMSTTMLYADGSAIAADVEHMSKEEICNAAYPVKFGRLDHRSRPHLLESVSLLPSNVQQCIQVAAAESQDKAYNSLNGHNSKRRKTSHSLGHEVSDAVDAEYPQIDALWDFADGEFLKPQAQEIMEKCISNFINQTGNKALATAICIACARELALCDTQVMDVAEVPNGSWLIPQESHPKHHLTNGMLLHHSALTGTPARPRGHICDECLVNLRKNCLPRLALTNNMWISDIPFELAVLTLPERVLIARNFPAAHIVKLFPLKKGAPSTNCALRGNVSTYRLDMDEIADMVQGNIMPNPSQILASTIGVTLLTNVPPGVGGVKTNETWVIYGGNGLEK
jgi:hypothetical protein